MIEPYQPSPEELRVAASEYTHYAMGVAFLHKPHDTASIHQLDPEQQIDRLINDAGTLMYESLKGVIRGAFPLGHRSRLVELQDKYDQALPHMLSIMDAAYAREEEWSPIVDSVIRGFRPAAMTNHVTYRLLCRSRTGKITLPHLMDRVPLDPAIADRAGHRTLIALKRAVSQTAVNSRAS